MKIIYRSFTYIFHGFIRKIAEGTGWIIDGFPQTYNQAKLLEKALSGFDATDREMKKMFKKASSLVPDPRPAPPAPDPKSGIDVVIHFDVPDELCLKRAAGRYRRFTSCTATFIKNIASAKTKAVLKVVIFFSWLKYIYTLPVTFVFKYKKYHLDVVYIDIYPLPVTFVFKYKKYHFDVVYIDIYTLPVTFVLKYLQEVSLICGVH